MDITAYYGNVKISGYLLEHYQPEMADYLTNLRQQQLMKSGGIL